MSDQSTPKTASPCQCNTTFAYTLEDPETDEPMGSAYGPCGQTTSSVFAPGHDAKLKSLLQRLHVAGEEYHVVSGGMLVSTSPMLAAAERGWEHFLRSSERIAAKAAADKASRQAEKGRKALARAEARQARSQIKDEAPVTPSGHAVIDGPPASQSERNLVTGTQVKMTVRGREVDGEILTVDGKIARVRYMTSKGQPATSVKRIDELTI